MGKRYIKKSVVHRQEYPKSRSRSREKYREKNTQTVIDEKQTASRRYRLAAIRRMRQYEEKQLSNEFIVQEIVVKLEYKVVVVAEEAQKYYNMVSAKYDNISKYNIVKKNVDVEHVSDESSSEYQKGNTKLLKPVFITRYDRKYHNYYYERARELTRKKRSMQSTLKQLMKYDHAHESDDQYNDNTDSEDDNMTNIPDDSDTINEQYEYYLWKIRYLKRIRKTTEERQKATIEKAELERRRHMNNEYILLENRDLGSDATSEAQSVKYVFMQKYYHKGAFYQDSDDPVFKRDYNLPTPMYMQDKSTLPSILQKRKGDFGKKGQSKHTHLTNEDTTNLNPLTRPDESLMAYWKRKTGGYKGAYQSNV